MVCHSRNNIVCLRKNNRSDCKISINHFWIHGDKIKFLDELNGLLLLLSMMNWTGKIHKTRLHFCRRRRFFQKINEFRTCNGMIDICWRTNMHRTYTHMWVHCLHVLWGPKVPISKLYAMPHIKYDLMSSNICICGISFFNGSCFPSKSYHFIIQCQGPPRFKSELCLLNSFNVKRNRNTSFTMNSIFPVFHFSILLLSIINVHKLKC